MEDVYFQINSKHTNKEEYAILIRYFNTKIGEGLNERYGFNIRNEVKIILNKILLAHFLQFI